MDKKIERANKDKILRRVAKELKESGFIRTKTTYFVRENGDIVQFLHFHKLSHAPCFRIHTCLRVLNDPRDWIALLGFHSFPYECVDSPSGKKYNLRYHKTDESIERCTNNIIEYVNEVSEPWFQMWSDSKKLLESAESPLGEEERAALHEALIGNTNEKAVESSRMLLKIA